MSEQKRAERSKKSSKVKNHDDRVSFNRRERETIGKWSWLHFSHCSLLVGLLSSQLRSTMTLQKSSAAHRRRVRSRSVSWVAMNSTTRSASGASFNERCHLSMWAWSHKVLIKLRLKLEGCGSLEREIFG